MEARRVAAGLDHGMRTALQNNLSAYGFSVMITATFGVLTASLGSATVGDVFLFVAGAISGVTVIDAITSRGFRKRLSRDQSDVVALGAALGYFSAGLSVGAAALVAQIEGGLVGWGGGALAATSVYVLLAGVELTLARFAQERREETEEEEGEVEEEENGGEGGGEGDGEDGG